MGQVEIVLGRSGTGKSHRISASIYEQLKQSPLGAKLFWIVPGDASYATEKMLLERVPTAVRAEVITLTRLAERAHLSLTDGRDKPVNTTGKRLLLAEVYRQVGPRLDVLNKAHPSIAFLDAVLDVFSEMSLHLVSLEVIETALEAAATSLEQMADSPAAWTGRSLLGKLRDLCVLYWHWKRTLSERGLYDPTELLHRVTPQIADWDELHGATVYVDGFAEMSPRDLAFVTAVAEAADSCVITLCMDGDWALGDRAKQPAHLWENTPELLQLLEATGHPLQVFAPQTLHLYERLVQACHSRGLTVAVSSLSADTPDMPAMGRSAALQTLEIGLFSERQGSRCKDASGLQLIAAQNPRTESDGIAMEIASLMHEQNRSLRDITVLVPSLEEYAGYLRDSFHRFEIPHYIDDFPPFSAHPLAKFILTALQAGEERFAVTAMARLLKSDFCGISRDEADWLETYIRKHELSGPSAWFSTDTWQWERQSRDDFTSASSAAVDDERADALRRRIAVYLNPFWRVLGEEECTPNELAQALWQLLQAVGAKRTVAEWMVNEDAEQSPLEASLHEQAWQRMMALLTDLWETGTNTPLRRSFLVQVIRSDIAQQSLATIPAGIDEVLVTEYGRARAFTSPVVFVLGAVDGALPRKRHAHGLLQDEERTEFRRLFGESIGYTSEELQLCERLTVYSVLTRARERLYLSYPLANAEGKGIRPAMTLSRIRDLYQPGAVTERLWTAAGETSGDSQGPALFTEKSALFHLVSAIRAGCLDEAADWPLLQTLLAWFEQGEEHTKRLGRALAGTAHATVAERLLPETARALYGDDMRVNVYQLESFAACPYQHFAKYGLKLQEDAAPDVTAAARGSLIHDVLNAFVLQSMRDLNGWRGMSDDAATAAMRGAFNQVLEEPKMAGWQRREIRRQQALEALSVLESAAVVLTRHARHGTFSPVAMELSFGDEQPDSLPGLQISLANGATVSLRGRIDRIDVAGDDSGHAFRIIDYKSSELDIDLNKVEHGLRLQLPVYAAVVERHSEQLFGYEADAAGLIYIPLVKRATFHHAPEDDRAAREEAFKKMRARGLIQHDGRYVEWMDARLTAGEESELFKKVYKKDGSVMKSSPTLERSEWRQLLARAMQHVGVFAQQIQSGDIRIAPYQLSPTDQACTFCSFASVCQVDKRWDSRPVRYLERQSKEQVLEKWAQSGAGEGNL